MNDDILRSMRIIESASAPEALTESTKETKTGRVHKGTYGTSYDGDADEKKAAEPAVKRGRGRPKKGSDDTGEVKKYDWSAFTRKVDVPKHKGEVRKHKMVGEGADMAVQQVTQAMQDAGFVVEPGEVVAAKRVGDAFLCVGYDGNMEQWIVYKFYPSQGDFGGSPEGEFGSQEEAMTAFQRMNESESISEVSDAKVYRHKGNYGTSYDGDADEKKAAAPAVKRGRGRPKKGSDDTGEVKKYDFSAFTKKVPVGKHTGAVTKHKMVGEETKETKTGRIHKGSYGTSYDGDADEKKAAAPEVKRGRGRPRKGADNSGEVKKYDFSAFTKKVDVPKHKGEVRKHKMIGESSEACASAITRRIMLRHSDLLMKHGPEAVMNAIDDVCSSIGDLDEIGSSDVSAWVKQVISNLDQDQLNELSKDTLKSYADKASSGVRSSARYAFDAGRKMAQGDEAGSDRDFEKAIRRSKGVQKAIKRMDEGLVLKRAIALISEAVVLEKKMTAKEKAKREEIVKGMKKDAAGFKERYGKRAKDVMYATATKKAMKECADPVLSITESTFRKISDLFEDISTLSADTLDGLYDGSIDIEDALHNGTGLRGNEQEALIDMYNRVANENGLHPDDDFEQIYDYMMGEIEQAVIHGDFDEPDAGDEQDRGVNEAAMSKLTKESKPDFLDMDKDGDKKEPMKKAIKDKQIDESCGMPAAPTGQEKIDLTPTLLIDLLKLAGLGNPASMAPYAPAAVAVTPDAPVISAPEASLDLPDEIPMEEEYANSPVEEYGDLDSIVHNGDDLHKEKNTYPKVAGGDNPRRPALSEDLWQQYQALKSQVK